MIFLSKHSAASGTRSLTVHPIGIPWSQHKNRGDMEARVEKPHSHISHLYRKVYSEIKSMEMTENIK